MRQAGSAVRADMQSVAVALALDEGDRPLLQAAIRQAKAHGAKLYLVHVAPPEADFVGYPKEETPPSPEAADVGYAYDRDVAARRRKAEHAALQALRAEAEAQGVAAEALLIEGRAAGKIAEEAGRLGAGLIVVGTHQRGALGEWLLGSTSRDLLRRTPCPVLVVPIARA